VATVADLLSYGPTLRKCWQPPHEDSVTSFFLNSAKFAPSLLTLGSYSVATCIPPSALVIANAGVVLMLLGRRWQLDALKAKAVC
jgi:hypothetical protein